MKGIWIRFWAFVEARRWIFRTFLFLSAFVFSATALSVVKRDFPIGSSDGVVVEFATFANRSFGVDREIPYCRETLSARLPWRAVAFRVSDVSRKVIVEKSVFDDRELLRFCLEYWTASLLLAFAVFFGFSVAIRHRRAVFAIGFVGLLCLPLLRIETSRSGFEEGRRLAPFPKLAGCEGPGRWTEDFEAAYNDRFFMRPRFIRLYRALRRAFGGRRGMTVAGVDGWRFLRSTLAGEYRPLEPGEIKGIAAYLDSLDDFMTARGKRFVFVVAPDKAAVIDEGLGRYRAETPSSPRNADVLVDYLRKHCRFPVVYERERLRRLQKDPAYGDMYYKADSHWTAEGSWFGVYQPLTEVLPDIPHRRLAGWRERPAGCADLVRLDEGREGGIPPQIVRVPIVSEKGRFESRKCATAIGIETSCGTGVGKLFCYHDSFMLNCRDLLARDFAECTFRWQWKGDLTTFIVGPEDRGEIEKCDVLVIEVLERMLPNLIGVTPLDWK